MQLEGLLSKTSALPGEAGTLVLQKKKLQDKYQHEAELEFAKKKI